MMGQNSFSNTQANSNGANIPGAAQPAGYPAPGPVAPPPSPQGAPATSTPPIPTQPSAKKFSPTVLIIAIVSALVGAGIAVGIMLLINNKPTTDKNEIEIRIEPASIDHDGSQTIEEGAKQYDEEIEKSTNEEEKFSWTMNKVTYYAVNEDYDSALAMLNAIDVASLDSYDQYRVYNHYVSIYEVKGDTAEAERYQQLSDEALSKELEKVQAEQTEEDS